MGLVLILVTWVLLHLMCAAVTPQVLGDINAIPLISLIPTPLEIFLWQYGIPTLLTGLYAMGLIGHSSS